MNVVKIKKENGDTILRVSYKIHPTKKRHGAYLISTYGIYRVYYTDNQKRFPIFQQVMDV